MTPSDKQAKGKEHQQEKKVVKRIALIRIKGKPGLKVEIKKTLDLLSLYKKNHCVVIPATPVYVGMVEKVKNTITWGEIDEKTCKMLLEKRGRLAGKQPLTAAYLKEKLKCTVEEFVSDFMAGKRELKDIPGLKRFFKLTPPRHGFEKKGIKVPYSLGGVLGYRKEGINDLIQRMV